MGPEQVYESIRTAIRSVSDQPIDSSLGTEHRREWVEQFVQSYGTDENDEQLAFEGNISQAMLMMNGEDLAVAIPLAANEVTKALRENAMTDAPERLAMATLNRLPTENEEQAFRNRYRTLSRSLPADQAVQTATEDLLWAYLNSSEFVSVH
jgi:glutaminase